MIDNAFWTQLKATRRLPARTPVASDIIPIYSASGSEAVGKAALSAIVALVEGGGDVVGPASATDNAVVRFDLTTGKLVQNSAVTIADTTGAMALLSNSTSISLGATPDVFLVRDAANTLAQRNGVNAQTFRVFNTWTDASNNEFGTFNWSTVANRLTIGPVAAGSGTLRSIGFTSHVLWNADNTYDIGASGATRPRNYYGAGTILVGGSISAGPSSSVGFDNRAYIQSPADSILRLVNNAASDFDRLQFGGGTASFPALFRSGAALHVRLADDSAFATLKAAALINTVQSLSGAGAVDITNGTTAFTSTGAAQALSLANGAIGQMKRIIHVVDGGSGVLTPTNLFNGSTITFTNVGDAATLQFLGTEWHVMSLNGAVLG